MITEDYVSFETAKILKEKGFDEATYHDYTTTGIKWFNDVLVQHNQQGGIACPTLQMAMKWLREKYCLHFIIQPMMSMPSCELKWVADTYDISIFYKELSEFKCVAGTKLCDSPEEACEEAIQYCLENLI